MPLISSRVLRLRDCKIGQLPHEMRIGKMRARQIERNAFKNSVGDGQRASSNEPWVALRRANPAGGLSMRAKSASRRLQRRRLRPCKFHQPLVRFFRKQRGNGMKIKTGRIGERQFARGHI